MALPVRQVVVTTPGPGRVYEALLVLGIQVNELGLGRKSGARSDILGGRRKLSTSSWPVDPNFH